MKVLVLFLICICLLGISYDLEAINHTLQTRTVEMGK